MEEPRKIYQSGILLLHSFEPLELQVLEELVLALWRDFCGQFMQDIEQTMLRLNDHRAEKLHRLRIVGADGGRSSSCIAGIEHERYQYTWVDRTVISKQPLTIQTILTAIGKLQRNVPILVGRQRGRSMTQPFGEILQRIISSRSLCAVVKRRAIQNRGSSQNNTVAAYDLLQVLLHQRMDEKDLVVRDHDGVHPSTGLQVAIELEKK